MNNTLQVFDRVGLAPGDSYPSADLAAVDAITDINRTSIRDNVEYAGRIYRQPDGSFSYTAPRRGTIDSSTPGSVPMWMENAGDYHTHGGPDRFYGEGSEEFSSGDKDLNESEGVPGYLGTPSGRILKYDPNQSYLKRNTILNLTKKRRGSELCP